ncbi:hypothetical protein TRFO_15533 [Tritrichomonas foetus]|uniref:C2 DOCK-type domain-containing protein n=1 Tax=Tritrichomonas foetus TaxID=1144522 RepID=A0A1J4KSJ0_9EUKA|nr:hypothetical protein TRFO_15533 [Tritrichomonas foetus]|eukprot:OHT14227.1 hypothetical protein TRFO_15533 [Tritrichomonas foetus]
MNVLIDDFIFDDILATSKKKKLPWMNQIVQLIENTQNPFLSPDQSQNINYDSIKSSKEGKLFLDNRCDMKISLDKHSRDSDFNSFFTGIIYSSKSQDLYKKEKNHIVYISVRLNKMWTSNPFIEPIICTAFIYHKKTSMIISDPWNFVPKESQPFFESVNKKVGTLNVATFQVNPKFIQKSECLIFIILSHPTTVDNGAFLLKYYQNQSSSSSSSSSNKIKKSTFLKRPNAFSTFAWTYAPFISEEDEEKGIIEFPYPYLIDRPLIESDIPDLLNDVQNKNINKTQNKNQNKEKCKHLNKQVPFEIVLSLEKEIFPIIIRDIIKTSILPYLIPIHQFTIRLVQLKLPALNKSRNIIIRVSFVPKQNEKPICVMHSRLDPLERNEYEYSRCWYHEKSPKFDDYILMDLPYPIPPESFLNFEIFHIHAKAKESKPCSLIGSSVLPLVQKNVFLPDKIHTISVSCDKSSKLIVTTKLRSTLVTNDPKYYEFNKLISSSKVISPSSDLIKSIEPQTIVSNLIIILDNLLNAYKKLPVFSLQTYLSLYKTAISLLKPKVLDDFLNLFARFYAFREINEKSNMRHFQHQNTRSHNHFTRISPVFDKNPDLLIDIDEEIVQTTHSSTIDMENDDLFASSLQDSLKNQNNNQSKEDKMVSDSSSFVSSHHVRKHSQSFGTTKDDGYEEFGSVPLFLKIIQSINYNLQQSQGAAIDKMVPIFPFLFQIIIKSLACQSERDLTENFDEFVNLFSKSAAKSERHEDLALMFGDFVSMLFNIGHATGAAVANTAFIKNNSLDAILIFIKAAYKPELFVYSIRFIDIFRDCFHELLKMAFNVSSCVKMQPLFHIINKLCCMYEDDLKIVLASKLLHCLNSISLTEIRNHDEITHEIDVTEGIEFIKFILGFCDQESIQKAIYSNQVSSIVNLLHQLLQKELANSTASVNLNSSGLKKNAVVNSGSDTVNSANSPQRKFSLPAKPPTLANIQARRINPNGPRPPAPSLGKRRRESIRISNDSIISSIYRFIDIFVQVVDFNNGISLVGFLYCAMQSNLNTSYKLKTCELLKNLISKHCPKILEIKSPCFVRIVNLIFKTSLLLPHCHSELASIIETIFKFDLKTNNNNNRSKMICIRALSMMHYSQLTLNNFIQFMELFSNSENQGLSSFYFSYLKLKQISQSLGIPKLTPTQKAEFLFQRFFAFNLSPDAQILALEDLKKHQIEQDNIMESLCIVMLQATIIYEYLVRLKRISNFLNAKFNRKPDEHFTTLCKSKSEYPDLYYIGSTMLCPPETQSDLPAIPGFCDSDLFNEVGMISLMQSLFECSKTIQCSQFYSAALDIAWPLFETFRLYGQIHKMFENYEEFFQSQSHSTIDESETYFFVHFSGKIFDADNKKSFIYHSKPNYTLEQFRAKFIETYEILYGKKKVILDVDSIQSCNKDYQLGYIKIEKVIPADLKKRTLQHTTFYFDEHYFTKTEDINLIEIDNTIDSTGMSLIESIYKMTSQCRIINSQNINCSMQTHRIKRLLLTTKRQLPNIIERSEIIKCMESDLSPLNVVCEKLTDFIALIKKANENKNIKMIQQCLIKALLKNDPHGFSTIIQVYFNMSVDRPNELTKEVNSKNYHKANRDQENKSLHLRMKKLLSRFLDQVVKGVDIHSEWIVNNVEYLEFQIQLQERLKLFQAEYNAANLCLLDL